MTAGRSSMCASRWLMSAWLLGADRVTVVDHIEYRMEFAKKLAQCEVINFKEVHDMSVHMPGLWFNLATRAAASAGYEGFAPDACLINQYQPSAKLPLHQDGDEADLAAPIVSVSLGLPAVFLFGSSSRKDRAQRFRLPHGDVVG